MRPARHSTTSPSTTSALANAMVTSDTTQSGSSGAAAAARRNMRPPTSCPRPVMSDLSRLRAHEQSVRPHHQDQRHYAVDDEQFDLRHQMHGGGAADADNQRAD